MHHRNRRARRAVATLSIALAAAGVAAVAVPGVASANDPQPEVRARIIDGRLLVRGGDAGEVLALRSPAALPTTIDVDLGNDGVADVTFQRSLISSVDVRAGGGDDTVLIDETAGVGVPFTDTIPTTINGQDGDDLLLGGSGAENFHGGRDNDDVDGNRGNDTATLDAGDDEFIWDPGDGSDTIEGKSGSDLMTFNGAGGNENFAFVDNGGRLRFTRNVGNIVMDTNKVERVTVNALGGTDLVEIDDLARTDVTTIDIDEGLTLGAAGADGVVDSVFVDGTEYDDDVAISGSAGSVSITGLAATVNITDAETIDRLLFAALGGDDRIDASLLGADTMHLDLLGGDGDDTLLGGDGAENFLAGAGNDFVDGNRGNDTADLEADDDEFLWDPGDGSDIVEGRDGYDVMTFNGSGGDEIFTTTAIGDRMAFTRAIAVAQEGGLVDPSVDSIEVVTTPRTIPDEFVVDVSAMRMDTVIRLSDIPMPPGVTATGDPDSPVVTVLTMRAEVAEIEAADAEAAEEQEAAEAAEGEAPAEGGAAEGAAAEGDDATE